VYNQERPHEALGNHTPASVYRPSRRRLPERLPAVEYPGHYQVRFVCNAGTFRFRSRLLFIANALKQHYIGLEEVADGIWSVYFGRALLARLDERDFVIRP
jgi:putative transposase